MLDGLAIAIVVNKNLLGKAKDMYMFLSNY